MPLYEYQCRSCQKTADVRHGFKETFDDKCEACGGEMARVYSPAGIVFKGSGFYLTDSRKAAEAASAPGEIERVFEAGRFRRGFFDDRCSGCRARRRTGRAAGGPGRRTGRGQIRERRPGKDGPFRDGLDRGDRRWSGLPGFTVRRVAAHVPRSRNRIITRINAYGELPIVSMLAMADGDVERIERALNAWEPLLERARTAIAVLRLYLP